MTRITGLFAIGALLLAGCPPFPEYPCAADTDCPDGFACNAPAGACEPADAGADGGDTRDAGQSDAGMPDAGANDAGPTDGGEPDDGGTDGGEPDDGGTDGGEADGGGPTEPVCGDGRVEGEETCDGNCDALCPDPCVPRTGSAEACDLRCTDAPIGLCNAGDGCCPEGCTASNDAECTWIGTPCAGPGSTPDDACLTEEGTGWPGGYTTNECMTDANCPAASHCGLKDAVTGRGLCLADCNRTRTGYACRDRDGDGRDELAPAGPDGELGDACTNLAPCPGSPDAHCFPESEGLFLGGACTLACPDDACPPGGVCATFLSSGDQWCLATCVPEDDCDTSPGYACKNNVCVPSGTGLNEVGGTCQGIWDCEGGVTAHCQLEDFPGGYCTVGCTGGCPDGSYCARDFGVDLNLCVAGCGPTLTCREGYTCFGVESATPVCLPTTLLPAP